eukprot:PhF_6_TR12589/c0_g3_i1/m.19825
MLRYCRILLVAATTSSGSANNMLIPYIPVETFTTQYVKSVDNFSTARVLNYINRKGGGGGNKNDPFIVKVMNSDGATRYTASLIVPMPSPYAPREAAGIGATTKEAQILAAMHAERILGVLGVPIFGLASAQAKYITQVGKAFVVQTSLQPESTPSPPILCSVVIAAKERHCVEALWPRKGDPFCWHTMLSPNIVDLRSIGRISRWF